MLTVWWYACGISAAQAVPSLGRKDLSTQIFHNDLRLHFFNLALEELFCLLSWISTPTAV